MTKEQREEIALVWHDLIKAGADRKNLNKLLIISEKIGHAKGVKEGLRKAKSKEQCYFDTIKKLEKFEKEKGIKRLT